VPSLHARGSLRSPQSLLFVNKIISLLVFICLLGLGWVGLSYLRNDLVSRSSIASSDELQSTPTTKAAAVVKNEDRTSPEAVPLAHRVRLVYSCKGGDRQYHTASHLPRGCERSALAEQAAFRRGLKPCGVCIP
jgi:hypothetical protein